MRERAEWRAALGAMAAIAGVGLASGRELVLFFAQLKAVAFIGVLSACLLFGGMEAFIAAQGERCRPRSGLERIAEVLRLLFAAIIAAFMLARLGNLGALTLPMRRGYLFGALFGLLFALTVRWLKCDWLLGLALTLALGAFYAANALDARPPRLHLSGATEFALSGSVPAALILSALYAAMNAAAAAWRLSGMRKGTVRPAALGAKAAVLMGAVLMPAVAALLRGGDGALIQPMPWVVLSARWGLAGFWLCAGLNALCAAATLSFSLGRLLDGIRAGCRAVALYMLIGGLALFGILSFGRF